MTYELAKKLKDAGFPQREDMLSREAENRNFWPSSGYHLVLDEPELVEIGTENLKKRRAGVYNLDYLLSQEGVENTVYIPTLEELIEACGDMGEFHLVYDVDGWWATDNHFMLSNLSRGSDPSETIAKLWLKLNETKS